jgi:hypothetical protein
MVTSPHPVTCTVFQTGFTQWIATNITSADTNWSIRRQCGRKFVTDATAEIAAGINFNVGANGARPFILTVQVWRGVSTTTPLWTGTNQTYSTTGSGRVVNASSTIPGGSVPAGSKTVMCGTCSSSVGAPDHSALWSGADASGNIGVYLRASTDETTNRSAIMGIYTFNATGEEVPGAWSTAVPESGTTVFGAYGMTLIPAVPDESSDLANGQASMAATIAAAGEILSGINHDLANGTLSVGAALSIAGELLPGTDFALANGQVVIVGNMTIASGGLVYSFAPPPIAQSPPGWIRKRPSGRRRSGAKRLYDAPPEQSPIILPPSARKIVDSVPEVKGPEPRTLRDYLTLKGRGSSL